MTGISVAALSANASPTCPLLPPSDSSRKPTKLTKQATIRNQAPYGQQPGLFDAPSYRRPQGRAGGDRRRRLTSRTTADVDTTTVSIAQQTRYPWDCNIRITVDPGKAVRFTHCLEAIDNGGKVLGHTLPDGAPFTVQWRPELLHGINAIHSNGAGVNLTIVPYCARAHRGAGEMAVWIGG